MTAIILLLLGLILLCTFKTVRIFVGIVVLLMWWNWPAHSQTAPPAAGEFYKEYRIDGASAIVFTEDPTYDYLEVRFIPGWQLDPKCKGHEERWGDDDCIGPGLGFLIFEGQRKGNIWVGTARLDRDGCDEWFDATLKPGKRGALNIYPRKGSKCKAVVRPVGKK